MIKKTVMLGAYILSLLLAHPAEATFISITAEATASIQDNRAKIQVGVANTGDEPAYGVKISADIDGKIITGSSRDILQIGEKYTETLSASVGFKKPGRYPLILRVDYADKNLYPFTALSFADVAYQGGANSKVSGWPINASLIDNGALPVRVKNVDPVEHRIAVRLILPREITTSVSEKEVILKPDTEETMFFDIKNASALPGSNYQVYAILTYEDEQFHYTSAAGGNIHTEEEKPMLTRYKNSLIVVGVILSVITLYLNLRRKRQDI